MPNTPEDAALLEVLRPPCREWWGGARLGYAVIMQSNNGRVGGGLGWIGCRPNVKLGNIG